MRNGWIRIGSVGRRLGGIDASFAAHLEQIFGLECSRDEGPGRQRPCGRDAAMMADLAEVGFAQPKQRRAKKLGVAADVVVGMRARRTSPSLVRQFSLRQVVPFRLTSSELQFAFSRRT